ncbi:uncharacterized protein SCHCODRAFT_02198571 [Schizophyllum commune H4-8]|uniref:uncharacterized protein n=1 Tax=Schizophyllum commune (strain H4-8 / FGSC 9210) TaxID=578458 RepID=UPI00215E986B|nr:uncharacterized protein SCHCODRAFT_02198571 [Schizophyllum commune H4-8]KAI5896771.1 hypothetical protein SCHCODRAFT_02198571 [Schizophyllum commune H4-8]
MTLSCNYACRHSGRRLAFEGPNRSCARRYYSPGTRSAHWQILRPRRQGVGLIRVSHVRAKQFFTVSSALPVPHDTYPICRWLFNALALSLPVAALPLFHWPRHDVLVQVAKSYVSQPSASLTRRRFCT